MRASYPSRATVSDLVILDTSIFIDDLRTGCHQQRIQSLTGLIRTSSLVLAELWRGATKPAERDFLRALRKNHPILTPTEKNWLESGQILGRIREDRGFTPDKLRDLHFDVLIALSARSYGARLITSNRIDFEMVNSYRKLDFEIWSFQYPARK
jgi:predicted nucleic acid-binding protein